MANPENPEKISMQKLLVRLREIETGFRLNLANLRQNLATLDLRPELYENLKTDAEVRAGNLEAEVKQLRNELEAVKELLGLNGKKKEPIDIH
jgi:hypothetical protein